MISIVIPLFNKENNIVATLETVLAQTFQDFEIVVVDDGSTDGSARAVCSVGDDRIRLISQQNAGVSAARNRGVAEARGQYVAFLDADDLWAPDYLAEQHALAEKYPECGVFASNYEFRDTAGVTRLPLVRGLAFGGQTDGRLDNYFEVAAVSDPPLWTSAVMVRRDDMLKTGGFPVGVKSGEDLITWARLACSCGIAYDTRPKAIYCTGFSNPRPPEASDYVGEQLECMLGRHSRIRGLKRYTAFWYKMRMCRCLAHAMYGKAFAAFSKSLRYNPLQAKIYASAVKYALIGIKR